MPKLTAEQAKKIIEEIRALNGGISQEDRERTLPRVLDALENVRRKLGAATTTLARNLYSKDTRFVFELIQNAEDNNYTLAAAAGQEPYLEFSVYSDRIIVDSNEDGFSEHHVQAICSIGESTKTVTAGYIGEKGIGFKSVFKVASKVHIQSGPFSFFFEHNSEDGGLGMVTPHYQKHKEVPEGVRTRITMMLVDPGQSSKRAADFDEIPDTLIMFLKKLRRITINRYQNSYVSAAQRENRCTYSYDESDGRGRIRKSLTAGDSTQKKTSNYRVTRKLLGNLPEVEARKHTRKAEVVLAFPINDRSNPVIEQQHVFAFLPLCRAGFKFLIQCDFLTQASREDVMESPWNDRILQGVAETFASAILEFCDQPTLQYKWLSYLPDKYIPGAFWSRLRPEIINVLSDMKVLLSRSGASLKAPCDLRFVPSKYSDRNDEPLVKDLAEELYIASEYLSDTRYHDDLKELGVKDLEWWEFFSRLKADVKNPASRLKAPDTEEDWHTRISCVLLEAFPVSMLHKSRLQCLKFIPLNDGRWISALDDEIFIPDYKGIEIPKDLGFSLLNRLVLKNNSRMSLLTELGVRVCTRKKVVSRIRDKYRRSTSPNLTASISHQRFFYWVQEEYDLEIDGEIFLIDNNGERVYRHRGGLWNTDLYFECNGEYAVQQLVAMSMHHPRSPESSATWLSVHFLHPEYVKAFGRDERRGGQSWEWWLENVQHVRRDPRLVDPDSPSELSEILSFIAEHRKEKFLGTLMTYWHAYADLMEVEVAEQIGRVLVPCENGRDHPITDAYLPELKLKMECEKLGLSSEWPFLKLPMILFADWGFLKKFSTKSQVNLRFYLDAIQKFRTRDKLWTMENHSKVFDVYEAIEDHAMVADHETIQELFMEHDLIYVQGTYSESDWTSPGSCVWEGEAFMKKCTPLALLNGYRDKKRLARLFQDILELPNAELQDYRRELRYRQKEDVNLEDLPRIYHSLSEKVTEEELPRLRAMFQKHKLIYVLSMKQWCAPTSCLWVESTSIMDKLAIAAEYPDLKTFFVDYLQIDTPNVEMYIRELQRLEEEQENASLERVKELISEINLREPRSEQLQPLLSLHILPVKDRKGSTKLKTPTDDFAIVDRLEYGDAFKGKLHTLDLTLEEVHTLRHFLKALDLEGRYMSRAVKEDTNVRGGSEDLALSNEFRERARAIFRCAVHFESPRCGPGDSTIYSTLWKAVIYRSEGISKRLTLRQNGKPVTVESSTRTLHIDEENGRLRIYVPWDSRERRRCYLLRLPKKLLSHLDIDCDAAMAVMQPVLQGPVEFLDDVLEDNGIIEVPGLESFDNRSGPGIDNANIELTSATSNLSVDYHRSTTRRCSPTLERPRIIPTDSRDTHSRVDTSRPSSRTKFTPRNSPSPTPDLFRRDLLEPQALSSSNEYHLLLDRIIKAAETTRFPSLGAFNFDDMTNALQSEVEQESPFIMISNSVFGVRSENQMRHDMKIGAAGELFAFEVLQRLNLPGFDRDNWKSTIRKEVRVHEQYADMPPWEGAETADITYSDAEGELTSYLVDQGYLKDCQGIRPKYYLEVKTTTKSCRTPFYMSKRQFARMQSTRGPNPPPTVSSVSTAKKKVYIIIRVYNLGQENMGVRLYVDPEALRQSGELVFTAESYTVAPV